MSIVFALALLAQNASVTRIPSEIKDLEFNLVQEEWVHDSFPYIDPYQVLDITSLKRLIDFNGNTYKGRIAAYEQAKKMPKTSLCRLAVWGQYSTAPEISTRCQSLLAYLWKCDRCGGRKPRDSNFTRCPKCNTQCELCMGSGTYIKRLTQSRRTFYGINGEPKKVDPYKEEYKCVNTNNGNLYPYQLPIRKRK